MSTLLDSALTFAAVAHQNQKRKATNIPYIVHPVGVMLILIEFGENDPELLAAALLHDTVEDSGATHDQIRKEFGDRVAEIVAGCSEPDKDDTWENRKNHTIHYIKGAPRHIQLVSAADKLHNLRSMTKDHETMGDKVWARFKRGKDDIAWYYRSVLASLREGELRDHLIVGEIGEEIEKLFG
ncbi:MAG: bifunctional (p)ppGpp synthetase/guanosine-3',5'-bis(diphosphate) 3'-pyrophosphohydrolase [Chloroflexi bacterium]|nr:bifunctional (p)ppGpp synthetase/guanosine-3',5'-bis(diphosphate) 3'-pyrophosphohydrolase [Chloroflexota bacterium]